MKRGPPEELLFVYGTLRTGFENPLARRIRKEARFLHPARFTAAILVDLGHYPGLVPVADSNSVVEGDLFGLPPRDDLLDALDAYEGCSKDPEHPGEYFREKHGVLDPDGRTLSAWTYLLNRPSAGLPVVTGGDYLKYIHNQRR